MMESRGQKWITHHIRRNKKQHPVHLILLLQDSPSLHQAPESEMKQIQYITVVPSVFPL